MKTNALTKQNNSVKNWHGFIELSPQKVKPNLESQNKLLLGAGIAGSLICGVIGWRHYTITHSYAAMLAKGLSTITGEKINPKNLSGVLSKEELLKILPTLNENSYKANNNNIANGIFKADLHSHSEHSDGLGKVEVLLSQAADYADKLYEKTRQKFIFALTDHDSVDGVVDALKIIAANPEKYKNLRFVPGVELSFAHEAPKSNNACEISEILAYCINPFSKDLQNFLSKTKIKRENMTEKFLEEANKAIPGIDFKKEEFIKFYKTTTKPEGHIMNMHWQLHNYTQAKAAIYTHAKSTGLNPYELYQNIMTKSSKKNNIWELKEQGFLPSNAAETPSIQTIRRNLQPHMNPEGTVIAAGENTFEEIINIFSSDKGSFLAFAHPYFYYDKFKQPLDFIKELTKKSNGLIMATESYHQAYPEKIANEEISKLNSSIEKFIPYRLGGRDNHRNSFLN